VEGFTGKNRIYRLVYAERCNDVRAAIRREKQIKAWRREKRVALINASNPTWDDLAAAWYGEPPLGKADPSLRSG
jgi:putative endonuclease